MLYLYYTLLYIRFISLYKMQTFVGRQRLNSLFSFYLFLIVILNKKGGSLVLSELAASFERSTTLYKVVTSTNTKHTI